VALATECGIGYRSEARIRRDDQLGLDCSLNSSLKNLSLADVGTQLRSMRYPWVVVEGSRTLAGKQVAFDAEVAAIEEALKWYQDSDLHWQHLVINLILPAPS
jgi:hypothetical protein